MESSRANIVLLVYAIYFTVISAGLTRRTTLSFLKEMESVWLGPDTDPHYERLEQITVAPTILPRSNGL